MLARIISSFFFTVCLYAEANIKVLATTSIVADLVKQIAPNSIQLEVLMLPGVDPHLYKATPSDLKKINDSDLIIYNGLHLEGKLAKTLEVIAKQKPCIALGDQIDPNQLIYPENFSGLADPHIWFDVKLWQNAAKVLADFFKKHLPSAYKEIDLNYENYNKKLVELNNFVSLSISEIKKEHRVLITAHDAFSYFGKAYGIEVKGLQGISTAAEFGLYDVSELVTFIISRKIPAVFIETTVPERYIQSLIQGTRAKGFDIQLGGSLYSDSIGDLNSPAPDYISMFKYNVNLIKAALK